MVVLCGAERIGPSGTTSQGLRCGRPQVAMLATFGTWNSEGSLALFAAVRHRGVFTMNCRIAAGVSPTIKRNLGTSVLEC